MYWFRKKHHTHALRVLLVSNAFILVAGYMLGPIYALFVEEIGGDLMDASIAATIFALVAGVVTFASGRLSDKVKNGELIIIAGYLIMSAGFLSFFFIQTVFQLFVVQAFIGLGEAIYSSAFDSKYSEHLDGSHTGEQWGTWESMNYFISAIGALFGGLLVTTFSFGSLFIAMSILCFVGAMIVLFTPRSAI